MAMQVTGRIGALIGRALILILLLIAAQARAAEAARHGDSVDSFDNTPAAVSAKSPHVLYDIDASHERFLVHVPKNYSGTEAFGLVVYCDPGDAPEHVPERWEPVLERRKLLLVAPQKAGNAQPVERRLGLAVVAAVKMQARFKVDPARIYSAGYSGGARMAGMLGFHQSDIFHGTVQSCGADFFDAVPKVHAKPREADGAYGVFAATPEEVDAAKRKVRFVFITGDKDFRYGNVRDIYEGGFAPGGFQAKLIDVPGMEHVPAGPQALDAALAFIEKDAPSAKGLAPSTAPAAIAWATKPPAQWPQIVLSNDYQLKGGENYGGASGFLMRAANGAVVAVTAKHLLGDAVKLADVDGMITSWSMAPRTQAQRKVTLGKLAMRMDPAPPIDAMIFSLAQRATWPAEVLVPRMGPPAVGEVLYVVAVQNNERVPQNVYKATVIEDPIPHGFVYRIEGSIDTAGFSGAPVVDKDGHLVGVHLGHVTLSRGNEAVKANYAAPASALLEAVDAPAPSAAVKEAATPATVVTPAPATPDENVAKAAKALDMARNYLAVQKFDLARAKLQKIVQTYPGTPAAKEAKGLLDGIEGK